MSIKFGHSVIDNCLTKIIHLNSRTYA